MEEKIVTLVLDTLSQMGVTLTGMRSGEEVPEYDIELSQKNLIQSVEDTLKSSYGILWSLTYGKLTDENRLNKINLKYKVVRGEVS